MTVYRLNIKSLLILILIILTFYIGYLEYANSKLKSQIVDCNNIINIALKNDSIIAQFIESKSDSSGKYYVFARESGTGRPLKYNELDSMLNEERERASIYENILLSAKKIYRFDYSMRQENDTLILRFWDKRHTKIVVVPISI